jgi:hypothetical protein
MAHRKRKSGPSVPPLRPGNVSKTPSSNRSSGAPSSIDHQPTVIKAVGWCELEDPGALEVWRGSPLWTEGGGNNQ